MKEELKECLSINKEAIWVKTGQEKETMPVIINALLDEDIEEIYTWSVIKGVEKIKVSPEYGYKKEPLSGTAVLNPNQFLNFYKELQDDKDVRSAAIIFRDYDACLETNPMYKRMIKEIVEQSNKKYIPIIFTAASYDVPADLLDTFTLIDYTAPTKEEIKELLDAYEKKTYKEINNKEEVISWVQGFYYREIIELLDISFYRYNEVNLSLLKEKKIELINKTNLLSYETPTVTMEDIGGNKRFKQWFEETKYCFSKEAKKCGVDAPKGYLALGIAGCSKTLGAKAIAHDLEVPFLALDMSKLLSCKVGESEQRVARAIELIESCAPCVLLIDEVEKAIGGYASSNASDSGVVARIFGKILQMLNDNDRGIFCVMTSNNVQDLPPELTRAGRLDAIWYFTLPTEDERKDILDIHFRKRGYDLSNNLINEAAKLTKSYTGAELEQVAKMSIKKEFVDKMKNNKKEMNITENIIEEAIKDVVPISKSSKEKINALETWAQGRALYANAKSDSDDKFDRLEEIDVSEFDVM